jgi:hypothetical protein
MMTDPAFAIKNEVQQLVTMQIEILQKRVSLTSSELDEYHSRSEEIAALYRQLDSITRRRSTDGLQNAS